MISDRNTLSALAWNSKDFHQNSRDSLFFFPSFIHGTRRDLYKNSSNGFLATPDAVAYLIATTV
jgi:hypothetical protein